MHKVGHISDDALVAYYRGATALVATGLREGFCLPAAEAMACGTPVVAVDRGHCEKLWDMGVLLSRSQLLATLAEAMVKMADKKIRDTFAKRAIVQAKKFTWKSFANDIYDIIIRVMNIRATDLVLEIGSGNNPNPRSDILCDRYIHDNNQRAGGVCCGH